MAPAGASASREQTRLDAGSQPLAVLADLARRHHLADIEQRCGTARFQADERELTIAVLGRFNAGKTTLLNLILRQDLLPVQAVPATAVITRVSFGPQLSAVVTPSHGSSFAIETTSLAEWITETGNPGNRRGIVGVDVQTPTLSDLDHLVLVDTPGTGSTWEHNTDTSLRWLPHVGAALVAINATQPLSEDDVRLIELVTPHTPNMVVVLTKIDLLTESDLEAVTQHVRRQLRDRTGGDPTILPVSTAPRHRSERADLRRFLRQLNLGHDSLTAGLVAHRTAQLATECHAYLALARASTLSTDRAVEDLRRALAVESARLPLLSQQCRAQFQPLGQAMIEATQHAVRAEIAATVSELREELLVQLPSWKGTLAEESERFRDFLRQSLTNQLVPLAARAGASLEDLMADGLQPVQTMGEAFLQRLDHLVSTAIGHELKLPAPEPIPAPIESVDVTLNAVFDSHLELLSWAIPMSLVRGAVHHHFLSMLPWEVEKNLDRIAYGAVASARRGLEVSLADYIAQLDAVLQTCRSLIDSRPDDLAVIESDLATLQAMLTEPSHAGDAAAAG